MWLLGLLACAPWCEDGAWTVEEEVVAADCGRAGAAWTEEGWMSCDREGRFDWTIGDSRLRCAWEGGGFRCDGAVPRERARERDVLEGEQAGGGLVGTWWWTLEVDDGPACGVEIAFEAYPAG